MALYLGVDGGGTKTSFVLLDEAGRTAAEALGPSCYYFASGIGLVAEVLADGVAAVTAAAGVDTARIDYAFFGLPGYGELTADTARLRAIPLGLLGHDRYTCDNDMIGGWAGALGGGDGINVVAGTGSMAYGEHRGAAHRVGGWSEVFGDEGSAYWVAVRGLNAFSRMSDGRLPRGPLYGIVKARVGVIDDLDLIGLVVDRWRGMRGEIAELSKAVVEAEGEGDRAAAAILAEACDELAGLVGATRVALGYGSGAADSEGDSDSDGDGEGKGEGEGEETVPVSYSGGMFTAPSFLSGFAAALEKLGPAYRLSAPMFGPAVGSALYAMKKHGAAVPPRSVLSAGQYPPPGPLRV